jgi:HAD superfamily hydrolase (TIGR01509 family)
LANEGTVPPTLTIFDCDGVLVDSEAVACRICVPCLAEIGIATTAEDIADRYIGISAAEMAADIESRHGVTLTPEFHTTLRQRIMDAFEIEPLTIDGIDSVLAAHDGRLCVASGSRLERVRRCLTIVGLLDYFDPHIFSATQVARGKPAPDLFLFAAREMGVAPAECLVTEDSTHGVTAAVAAGMPVIGFSGGSHCRPGHSDRLLRAGATHVIQHMRELPGLLSGFRSGPY